jgi:hypothetical protein
VLICHTERSSIFAQGSCRRIECSHARAERLARSSGTTMTGVWRSLPWERAKSSTPPMRLVHSEASESREVEQARALIALRSLRPRDQAALELTYWEYLAHPSAAMAVGSTTGAFEIVLSRATQRLLSRIQDDAGASSALTPTGSGLRRPSSPMPRESAVARSCRIWARWRRRKFRAVTPDDERAVRDAMEGARQAAGRRPVSYDPRRLRLTNGSRDEFWSQDAAT